jgi:hypothetical protein
MTKHQLNDLVQIELFLPFRLRIALEEQKALWSQRE